MDSVELGTPKGHSRDGFPSCMMIGVSVGKTWRLGSTAGGWNNVNKHLIIWRLVHHHVWCLGGENLNKLGLLTTVPTCGLASAWDGGLRKLSIVALTHCTGGYRWGAQTLDCHLLLGEFWGSGRACSWSSRVAAVAVLENNILPQQSGPILASFFFFFVCFRSIFYDLRDKRSGILCPYPWIELKTLGVCELSVENNFLKGF